MKKEKAINITGALTELPTELLDQIAIEQLEKAQPWERIAALVTAKKEQKQPLTEESQVLRY
jgi:hypothetical protein